MALLSMLIFDQWTNIRLNFQGRGLKGGWRNQRRLRKARLCELMAYTIRCGYQWCCCLASLWVSARWTCQMKYHASEPQANVYFLRWKVNALSWGWTCMQSRSFSRDIAIVPMPKFATSRTMYTFRDREWCIKRDKAFCWGPRRVLLAWI